VTDYAPLADAKVNFVLRRTDGTWLVEQLLYIKAHS
jgi:hypothetical protein